MSERDIFITARAMTDPVARSTYVDSVCGGDADLRARVEALLRADDQPNSFLDHPAVARHDFDSKTTRTVGHEVSGETGDEVSLGFLEPATRPDSMGRIGHYHVLQILGRGAFGIVFRAFDDVLQRVVAVKVMAPQLAATSPARRRFMREAQSSAKVRHDNVVQVYDVKEQPLPYLVMEFIPGETLQQMLDRTGPLDVNATLQIGRQIAEGLAAAHATDLIHRDIKPGNILIEDGQRRVKITDFGLARAADDASISQSGIIAGTPMYMAPEQAKGEKLDQRADLFSLGSVLYQMLAGRPPFRANGTVAVLKRVADDTPRDIREIIPETPQWICNIIGKLHEKKPEERYQSAREVADVLADCEAQLKAHSRLKDFSRIPRHKLQRFAGRKWVVAAAVVLLPMLALALTELAGVTHLFRGRQATTDSIAPVEPKVAKSGTPISAPKRVALEFDGDADYVATPLSYDGSTPITVEATVQISEWPVHRKQHHSEIVGCTEQAGFGLGTSKDGFYISARIGDNYVTCYSDPDSRYLNRPVKLAGVLEGKKLRLYIDGKRVARNAFEHQFKPSPEKISLGTSPGQGTPHDGNGYEWAGTMFEVRISNISRYNDIDYDSNAPLLADEHTMALYRCDEGTGDVLKDSSGNGRHGKIVGAKWVTAAGSSTDSPSLSPPPLAVAPFDAKQARAHQEAWAKHLGVPVEFTNKIGMKFTLIPPGKFAMGSSKDEIEFWLAQAPNGWVKQQLPSEGPQHEVEITQPIYVGQTEVTVGQFRQFVKAKDYKTQAERERNGRRHIPGGDWVNDADTNWLNPGFAQGDDHPVVCVTWNEAVEFCNWLSEREGKNYRMPTEAEWEHSCRAGSKGRWTFGDKEGELSDHARSGSNADGHAWPIAGRKQNAWGLHDMHGNVQERCQDVFDANYYKSSSPKDPTGPSAGELRVVRGGSWNTWAPVYCRSAWRDLCAPNDSYDDLGFRVVLVVAPPASVRTESEAKDKIASPAIAADVKRIAALPAAEQVEEVRKELMRRNPGFDGKFDHKIEDGVVTELRIVTDQVTDIAPIRVFNVLRVLDLSGTELDGQGNGQLADLAPLKDMNLSNLTYLFLARTKIGDIDLVYFKNCKNLTGLWLNQTRVTNAGMANFEGWKKLQSLSLKYTKVDDAGLAHFKDCKDLIGVDFGGLNVTDEGLAHFKDCKGLARLYHTRVTDVGLAHFKDCTTLTHLHLAGTQATNDALANFKDCQDLTLVILENIKVTDEGLVHLKNCKKLSILNLKRTSVTPAAIDELKKTFPNCRIEWDGGVIDPKVGFAPFTDADIQRIAALPAAEQVEEVRKELMRRNPGFDGKLETKIEDGAVTEFRIVTDKVTDIPPIRVWSALQVLSCNGTNTDKSNGLLEDLMPLEGMNLSGLRHLHLVDNKVSDAGMACFKNCKNLTELHLYRMQVGDAGMACFKNCKDLTSVRLDGTIVSDRGLANLQDCKALTHLFLSGTKMSDAGLAHLKDCKNLTHLYMENTQVGDTGLAQIKGMPLKQLTIDNTGITDLTLLQGMPLEVICLTPKNIARGLDLLRDMKSLKTIGIRWDQTWPATEFWERYDKGEFKE